MRRRKMRIKIARAKDRATKTGYEEWTEENEQRPYIGGDEA